MVGLRLVDRGIGVISTIILARLLAPGDFGVVAMATSIMAMVELLGAFSFDMLLIQRPNPSRAEFDTVWTLNVLLGLIYALLLVSVAPLAAVYYSDSRLPEIIYWLAAACVITGLENVGTVNFRRELAFRKEFYFLFAKRLAGFVVTVSLAFYWRQYTALISGIIAGKTAGMVLSYALQPYRPRFSLAAARAVISFSGWLFLNNTLQFVQHRCADFVIGRMLGAVALGLHSVAYEMAQLPTTELLAPINRATYPGLARLGGDIAQLKKAFLVITSFTILITTPAALGLLAMAPEIVLILLGEKWREAIPLVQILAIAGALYAPVSAAGYVYIVLGKPRIITLLTATQVVLLIPPMIIGAMLKGLIGVACAIVVVNVILLPARLFIATRMLGIFWSEYIQISWRPLSASLVMWLTVMYIVQWLRMYFFPAVVILGLAVGLAAFVYIVVLLLLWSLAGKPPGSEQIIINYIVEEVPPSWKKNWLYHQDHSI